MNKMTVKTATGSSYVFYTRDGKLYVFHGVREYLVNKLSLGIGFPLIIQCTKVNLPSNELEENEMLLSSHTPVVEIRM